jgi:hypothetical protein
LDELEEKHFKKNLSVTEAIPDRLKSRKELKKSDQRCTYPDQCVMPGCNYSLHAVNCTMLEGLLEFPKFPSYSAADYNVSKQEYFHN